MTFWSRMDYYKLWDLSKLNTKLLKWGARKVTGEIGETKQLFIRNKIKLVIKKYKLEGFDNSDKLAQEIMNGLGIK